LLKKGVEAYSKTPAGALYTLEWQSAEDEGGWLACPMHEEPLHLVPEEQRPAVLEMLAAGRGDTPLARLKGDLCPVCRHMYRRKLEAADGDWSKVADAVRVRRLMLSEKDRVGIGTFQPKDEKNQDSTELTGDINYRKIAVYGSDSDPRAFNFDGEFNVANRGLIEFVEVLKLDVAFLYDLLTASQEHKIKPKKFAQCDIDEVIIGHTNEPEYRKLQNNEFMEALRDRTIRIDVPYITRLSNEVRIYERDFRGPRTRGKHMAPHTVEMAAMWAILTRLEDPKKATLSRLQKLKLYNGRSLAGFTEDNVKELRKETQREGMEGISPRYVQDKISNALVRENVECVNPFMVLKELESGLSRHSLIADDELRARYRELLSETRSEYENLVKVEVQKAISADEDAIRRLCANYIDNVKAYTQREKVKNPFTGEYQDPDERLMRSVEEKIDISEQRKDDFRREIMNFIGYLALEGKTFDYRTNERLHRALELKLFEDQKDSIKLSSLVTNVMDEETQRKIDVVKDRLMREYGYCRICASDVLSYVASIFARGDSK
jgi:serine protein kinase